MCNMISIHYSVCNGRAKYFIFMSASMNASIHVTMSFGHEFSSLCIICYKWLMKHQCFQTITLKRLALSIQKYTYIGSCNSYKTLKKIQFCYVKN